MVKLTMRMVKRPNYPSLLMSVVVLLMLVSSCVTRTIRSSKGVANTQFFKTMRPRMSSHHNGGAATATFNALLPKAVPIPPSGPSHHHNAIGIDTLHE
ncbi:unnamed protein product [Lactuca virosa]|uniref:Uncharacterized protein n=1 Tax=Lactuca virosa TaxID=75947 RepID=A0AAU9MBA6_9ASTR|nr:unnamed protein product [Lactuca virosa]